MVSVGTQVENIAGEIAASACLSDFVFLRPMRCEKNGKKELCDILLELDQEVVCIQIKAQDIDVHRSEAEQAEWAAKQVIRASRQASGALRTLKFGLYPVEAENRRRGKVIFQPNELRPSHGLVLIDYMGSTFAVPNDAPNRVHANIPVHYMSCVDFFELIGRLGTLPDLIKYLSERGRLPSWTTPLIGSERDAYAHFLTHEQEFLPTLDRGAFEGQWESLNGMHGAKYARKLEEDRYAEVVNHVIDEVHRIDPDFEAQLPEELREEVPAPDQGGYAKIATELNKMPKIVRREVGKKLLAKVKLSATTKRPRWFARYDVGGKLAFLFLVSSLPRESRIRALHNLLMALLCKTKLDRGVGVSLTDGTIVETGIEFLWVEEVNGFDEVTKDLSTKLFSAEKHDQYFDFPDEANRIVIPRGADAPEDL